MSRMVELYDCLDAIKEECVGNLCDASENIEDAESCAESIGKAIGLLRSMQILKEMPVAYEIPEDSYTDEDF